jgi:hypothetical protein
MLPAKVVVFGVGALARSFSDSHIRMSPTHLPTFHVYRDVKLINRDIGMSPNYYAAEAAGIPIK